VQQVACGILAEFLRLLRSSAWADFKREFVAADADMVTIRQGGGAADAPALYLDSVS
jgi:hypothetical protein